jgi:hypothetical protein
MGLDLMKYRAGVIDAMIELGPGATGGCELVCRLNGKATGRKLEQPSPELVPAI